MIFLFQPVSSEPKPQRLTCIFIRHTAGDHVDRFDSVWSTLFCAIWSSIHALYSPTRVCQSIFATRIILHIRDADKRKTKDPFTSTAVRSLMFADVLGQVQIEMEKQVIRIVSAQDQAWSWDRLRLVDGNLAPNTSWHSGYACNLAVSLPV
jgi:hypothetical protein